MKQLGFDSFGGGAGEDDIGKAVVRDNAGNVYIAGETFGALGEGQADNYDVFIAKFNSLGAIQWVSQLGYDTLGAAAGFTEEAYGIALDAGGNIFVTGHTSGSLAETNTAGDTAFLAKFDSNGVFQWVRQMGDVTMGAALTSYGKTVTVDTAGDILIAGVTAANLGEANAGNNDAWVAKYSAAGVFQWVKQLGNISVGAGASGNETVKGITTDGAANIFFAGHTQGSLAEANAGSSDAFIAKYNAAGVLQWVRQLGNVTIGAAASGTETTAGIVADGVGDVFIGGSTSGSLAEATAGGDDVFIAKYSSAGVFQFVRQAGNVTIGAAASGSETVRGIGIDAGGNIYVGGTTDGSLAEAGSGVADIFLTKFNAAGVFQASKQMGNVTLGVVAASFGEVVYGMAVDNAGAVAFAGNVSDLESFGEAFGGQRDAFVASYSAANAFEWVKQMGAVTGGTGASTDDRTAGGAIDASGNIYLAGSSKGAFAEAPGGDFDAVLVKFDSSGVLQWARQLGNTTIGAGANSADNVAGVAVDPAGNVYIAGDTQGSLAEANAGLMDAFVAKYNSAGVLQWVRQMGNVTIGAAAAGSEDVIGIAVDGVGNVYISGDESGSLGEASAGNSDAFVAKYDTNGVFQWVRQMGNITIGAGANLDEFLTHVAVDTAGDVYISGHSFGALGEANAGSADHYVAKYSSAGVFQWVRQLGNVTIGAGASGYEEPGGIVVDTAGNIFLTGATTGDLAELNAGVQDVYVAKYSSSGVFQWVKQLGNTTSGAAAAGLESVKGITLDSSGNVFISGATDGSFGEANNAGGARDVFAAEFNPTTGALLWLKQIGAATLGAGQGLAAEIPGGIAFSSTTGEIVLFGETSSPYFVEQYGGGDDYFFVKFE